MMKNSIVVRNVTGTSSGLVMAASMRADAMQVALPFSLNFKSCLFALLMIVMSHHLDRESARGMEGMMAGSGSGSVNHLS